MFGRTSCARRPRVWYGWNVGIIEASMDRLDSAAVHRLAEVGRASKVQLFRRELGVFVATCQWCSGPGSTSVPCKSQRFKTNQTRARETTLKNAPRSGRTRHGGRHKLQFDTNLIKSRRPSLLSKSCLRHLFTPQIIPQLYLQLCQSPWVESIAQKIITSRPPCNFRSFNATGSWELQYNKQQQQRKPPTAHSQHNQPVWCRCTLPACCGSMLHR